MKYDKEKNYRIIVDAMLNQDGDFDAAGAAKELTCTEFADEPTQERYEPTEATALCQPTPTAILASAIQRAEAMLPHGIEVKSEVVENTADIRGSCPHCDKRKPLSWLSWSERFPWTAEELAESFVASTRYVLATCISATCCDPLDRWVDGLRVRECLERFTQRHREYRDAQYDGKLDAERLWWQPRSTPEYERESKHATGWKLTDLQLAAARTAWSAQLRKRQAEAREKERMEIVCERDEEGE